MSESFDGSPGPPEDPGDEQFAFLEQTFSVQEKQMSELKEKVLQFEADKKEKAASMKSKADECYQKLMNLRSSANKNKLKLQEENEPTAKVSTATSTKSPSTTSLTKTKESLNMTIEVSDPDIKKQKVQMTSTITPQNQKMILLKQQTEENKRKMAERISSQKGIAIKVNKLLEQFDNMQTVFNPVVGISFDPNCTDVEVLRNKIYSLENTVSQLNAQLQEARQNENISDLLKSNMSYLELQNELNLDDKSMLQHMHNLLSEQDSEKLQLTNEVFDLKENLKEKDSVIDAKTKAITLMSEDLSRKGKNTVDLLEETKLEMVRMQHNFVQIESNLRKEIEELIEDNKSKDEKYAVLKEHADKLEVDHDNLQKTYDDTKKTLEEKISELEKGKEDLLKSNKDLLETIKNLKAQDAPQNTSRSPKKGKKKWNKSGQSSSNQNQSSELQNRIRELETQVSEYQAYITIKDDENSKLVDEISSVKTEHEEKCKEILSLQENIVKLEKEMIGPSSKSDEVIKLEQLLDEAKANSKKQLKYLQKQVDSFGKISDAHQEVVTLNQKVFELNHKVAELEEEKGNLQLHLVDYDTNKVPDSEMKTKLTEAQSIVQSQIHSIALLESQKFDLVQDLHIARQQISALEDELADLTQSEENAVSSEISTIQLEEKLDNLTKINLELTQSCDELRQDKIMLEKSVNDLTKSRNDLTVKLDECLCENEELVKKIDRIERLNAEKVSSAESIEIVDNLTQKEKMEIENFNKGLSISEDDQAILAVDKSEDMIKPVYDLSEDEIDLNISVAKLTEESSDLMEKIALFTQERMEVMARLESLQIENQSLMQRISIFESDSGVNVEEYLNLVKENERMEKLNEKYCLEKDDLASKLDELTADRNILQDDVNKLLKEIKDLKSDHIPKPDDENASDLKPDTDDNISELKELCEKLSEENIDVKQHNEQLNLQIKELDTIYNKVTKDLQNLNEEYELHKQTSFARDCEYKDIVYKLEKEQEKYKAEIEDLNKSHADLIREMDEMRGDAADDRATIADVYKDQIDKLNEEIKRLSILQKRDEDARVLEKELGGLKVELENNKTQCAIYIDELKAKDDTIRILNEQIMELYERMEHVTNENKDLEEEINNLMDEASRNSDRITSLLDDVARKDSKIQSLCDDLQVKNNELRAVQDNLKSLRTAQSSESGKYTEVCEVNKKLEIKNKESIEKMKKLAANLKKKSALCAEYEMKLKESQNVKIEEDAKQKASNDNSSDMQKISLELEEKSKHISDLNKKLKELTEINMELSRRDLDREDILKTISRLEQSIRDKEAYNDELMDRINEHKHNYETSLEGIKAKLNEKEVYIESLEIENNSNKEKVSKLIDGIASIEERRCMLEERAEVLDAKLNEKSAVCSEFANNEDLLIRRMKALVDEDEVLEKKMRAVNEQNEQLNSQIQDLMKQNNDLNMQSQRRDEKIKEYEDIVKTLRETENEYVNLVTMNNQLQFELKNMHAELREREERHRKELDDIESDFSTQLQISENERRSLVEALEKLQDGNDSLQDEIVKLKDTIHQLEQNKTDLERDNTWIKLQNDSMLSVAEEAEDLSKNIDAKEDEIRKLREQLNQAELMLSKGANVDHSLTENLHSEINELKLKLADKDKQIENYQRQNMQLQMAASFGAVKEVPFFQSAFDQGDSKGNLIVEKENIISDLQKKIEHLESKLAEENKNVQRLLVKEIECQKDRSAQMQMAPGEVPFFQMSVGQNTSEKVDENIVQDLKEKTKNLEIIVSVKSEHIDELQKSIIGKDNEITALQNGASSLAARMEEMIKAYQYLENELEKKQRNEFVPTTKHEAEFMNTEKSDFNMEQRIRDLEQLLREAQAEKEEALYRLQQLVYDMDNLKKQQVQFDIESQCKISEPDNKFKDVVDVSLPVYSEEGNKEIVEETMVAKKTYVCHKDEPEQGWGLDEEEVILEETYQNTSAPSNNKISMMQKIIDDLEAEKSKLNEDYKQQQMKLAKSMMKLKEYKNKNTALMEQIKTLKNSSDGLDFAIQEVLTLRIEELENEVKNNKMELEKNSAEKSVLNKRIDVLTAANEKMIECKERQDLEVERLSMRIKQQDSQIHEWDLDVSKPKSSLDKQVSSVKSVSGDNDDADKLKAVIRDLTIDNEELQALLEDQKKSNEDRERKLENINVALSAQVDELTEKISEMRKFNQRPVSDESDVLRKNLQVYQERIQNIVSDYNLSTEKCDHMDVTTVDVFVRYLDAIVRFTKSLKENNQRISEELERIHSTMNDLNQQISDKCTEIENLQKELAGASDSMKLVPKYKSDLENLNKQFTDKCAEFSELQKQYENLVQSNLDSKNLQDNVNELQSIITQNNGVIDELKRLLDEKSKQYDELLNYSQAHANMNTDMENLQRYANELQNTIENNKNIIENLNIDLMAKSQKIDVLRLRNDENVQLQNQNQELRDIIGQNTKTIEDLQNVLREKTSQMDLMQRDMYAGGNSNAFINLQQENNNLKQIIEQNKNIIDDLNARLFNVTTQFEQLQNTKNQSKQSENINVVIEQYKNTVDSLNAQLFERTCQIELMQKQFSSPSSNEDEISSLHAQLLDKSVQIENLQKSLAEENNAVQAVQELNAIIESNRCIVDNLQAGLSEKTSKLEQIQNEYSQAINESNRLQQHIGELNTALEQNRASIDNLTTQLTEKSKRIEFLEQAKLQEKEELKTQKVAELESSLKAHDEQWTELVEQRCREIADSWKVHLVEVESQFAEKESSWSIRTASLEQQIKDLNEEVNRLNSLPRLDEELASLREDLESKQRVIDRLTEECKSSQLIISEHENDVHEKDERITKLSEEIVDVKTSLVDELGNETKKWTDVVSSQKEEYRLLESKFDDLTREFESSRIENEEKLQLKDGELQELRDSLERKSKELEVLTGDIQDLATTLEEERKQTDAMRSALESQELELVEMKERLAALGVIGGEQVVAGEEASAGFREQIQLQQQAGSSSEQKQKQSELDLAMYMLHQRDMRCEELTLEVLSLLEERDTLQLRLSSAIRANESMSDDIRDNNEIVDKTKHDTASGTDDPVTVSTRSEMQKGSKGTKTRDFEMLKNKLSELHALDHSRDLRISDDRRLRQEQQMAMVERDYEKLPEEAKKHLIDADYTLSRDYQGPSTYLLNWLWGKNTKKVEHL